MNIVISTEQLLKLKKLIQEIMNTELKMLREESEEWGLGEMDELNELESIDEVVVDDIVTRDKMTAYVKLYSNSNREDFDNVMATLEYGVNQWVPMVELHFEIIYK
jgi:hypothetical protein